MGWNGGRGTHADALRTGLEARGGVVDGGRAGPVAAELVGGSQLDGFGWREVGAGRTVMVKTRRCGPKKSSILQLAAGKAATGGPQDAGSTEFGAVEALSAAGTLERYKGLVRCWTLPTDRKQDSHSRTIHYEGKDYVSKTQTGNESVCLQDASGIKLRCPYSSTRLREGCAEACCIRIVHGAALDGATVAVAVLTGLGRRSCHFEAAWIGVQGDLVLRSSRGKRQHM